MASVEFHQWEIWLVDWKHEDGASKARPALLVSSTRYGSEKNLVWAMKITTAAGLDPGVIKLDPSLPGWPATGLRKPCFLYVGKIQTIPLSALIRKYGDLPASLVTQVQELMKQVTGLNIP